MMRTRAWGLIILTGKCVITINVIDQSNALEAMLEIIILSAISCSTLLKVNYLSF